MSYANSYEAIHEGNIFTMLRIGNAIQFQMKGERYSIVALDITLDAPDDLFIYDEW